MSYPYRKTVLVLLPQLVSLRHQSIDSLLYEFRGKERHLVNSLQAMPQAHQTVVPKEQHERNTKGMDES